MYAFSIYSCSDEDKCCCWYTFETVIEIDGVYTNTPNAAVKKTDTVVTSADFRGYLLDLAETMEQ